MSRADLEQSSGLLRTYITRVELGQSVPTLEALERFAAALEVPLYWLFYAEEVDSDSARPHPCPAAEKVRPESRASGSEARLLLRLAELTGRRVETDPAFLLDFARQVALGKPEN
jgi:transcriptional regulator with XRE-family HTH domain